MGSTASVENFRAILREDGPFMSCDKGEEQTDQIFSKKTL